MDNAGVVGIRRARPGDLDALLSLIREFCDVDQHPFDAERVTSALGPLLADDMLGHVWLIDGPEPDGEPIGYGLVTWGYSLESGGRDALLDELYVRDRGRGIGTEAVEAMLDAAAAAGAKRVFLETERHNERVRSFYTRLGFVTDDSVWMSMDLPEPPPSAS